MFQIKHLVADYYLQTPYMYLNKGKRIHWEIPLAAHALVHAFFTFGISLIFLGFHNIAFTDFLLISIGLASIDFITHFVIDRWKATRKSINTEPQFWINLGWDQMLHHLVGLGIIATMMVIKGNI